MSENYQTSWYSRRVNTTNYAHYSGTCIARLRAPGVMGRAWVNSHLTLPDATNFSKKDSSKRVHSVSLELVPHQADRKPYSYEYCKVLLLASFYRLPSLLTETLPTLAQVSWCLQGCIGRRCTSKSIAPSPPTNTARAWARDLHRCVYVHDALCTGKRL